MKGKKILTIGAHIGDMELSAGGVLATNALSGGSNILLALTAGERGNPIGITQADYRIQKINEANTFAQNVNGRAIVFDYPDGELPNNEEVRLKVANLIREEKPDFILSHWQSSLHKDHHNTHLLVQDAQFYAGVDIGEKVKGKPHYAPLYFTENWEDSDYYVPYLYIDITLGFDLWKEALKIHWFVMNSKSFDYYDYYLSLARVNGCINKTKYAQTLTVFDRQKRIRNMVL